MHLPESIAVPLFRRVYPHIRRRAGSPVPAIRRLVKPVDGRAAYAFNRLFNASLLTQAQHSIEYDLPYPKIDFLNYLCDWRGLVAHGTSLGALEMLEPVRLSTDNNEFGNRRQIFASPDAIWALWFAILDKSRFRVTRNGCLGIGGEGRREKYYHFELERTLKGQQPFISGTIYLARAEDFPSRPRIPMLNLLGCDFEEWGSSEPVKPLARLAVEPSDFPYLDQVQYCLEPRG